MSNLFLVFFFVAIVSACEERAVKSLTESRNDTTVFNSDIPKNKQGKAVFFERMIWERDYLGGLDTLENGYPTLQIRIWYEYDRPSDRQIVVIKKTGEWKAELHTTSWNYTNDSAYVTKRTIRNGIPGSGWNTFIDSLIKLDVLNLPDQSKIPGMDYLYNTHTVHVEIAEKNRYRFYSYTSPATFINEFSEAAKMEKIMELIEHELGFKRLGKI